MKIEELRRLAAEANPAPWELRLNLLVAPGHWDTWISDEADAALIAALRNNADALLDVAEQMREWHPVVHNGFQSVCPDDCSWKAALDRLEAQR